MAFTLKVNGTGHSVVVKPDTIGGQVGGALRAHGRQFRHPHTRMVLSCAEPKNGRAGSQKCEVARKDEAIQVCQLDARLIQHVCK